MHFEVVDLLHYSTRSFGIRCSPRRIIVLGNIANLGYTIQRGKLFIILFFLRNPININSLLNVFFLLA